MSAFLPTDGRVDRARLLMERRRYDQAETEFRGALVEHPDNAMLHGLISICQVEQDKHDEALASARMAVVCAPDLAFSHAVLASVHLHENEYEPARTAIGEALRLEPNDSDHWGTLAAIHLEQKQWTDGLEASERGLRFDPEDVRCINLRAMALVGLGRKDEADATVREALNQDPENAVSHANQGWTCLHRGEHREALEHFREALRLEPDMEWARTGLVQALRARYVVYRWLLAYFLWSSRLGSKMSWAVVIIGYVAFRLLRAAATQFPGARPVLIPIVVLVALTFLLTWIGTPLFDTLLRFNRYGRYALNRREKLASNWLVGLFGLAGAMALAAWRFGIPTLYWPAIFTAMMVLPVTHSLQIIDDERRRKFAWGAAGLGLCAAAYCAIEVLGINALAAPLLLLFIGGFIGYQILAVRSAIHQ